MHHIQMFGPEEYPLDIRDQLQEFLKINGEGIDVVSLSQSVSTDREGSERHFFTVVYKFNGNPH